MFQEERSYILLTWSTVIKMRETKGWFLMVPYFFHQLWSCSCFRYSHQKAPMLLIKAYDSFGMFPSLHTLSCPETFVPFPALRGYLSPSKMTPGRPWDCRSTQEKMVNVMGSRLILLQTLQILLMQDLWDACLIILLHGSTKNSQHNRIQKASVIIATA